MWFPSKPPAENIVAYSDSNWAGALEGETERRSVSSGVIMIAGYNMSSWSRTQQTMALASEGAEFVAGALATTESLGVAAMMEEIKLKRL